MAYFVSITPILCCVCNISFQGVGGWVGPQFLWENQNTRPSSSHPVFSRSVRPCLFLIKPFVLGSLSNQTDPVEFSPQHDKKNLGTARVKPFFDQLIFSGRSLSMFRLTAWCAFTFFWRRRVTISTPFVFCWRCCVCWSTVLDLCLRISLRGASNWLETIRNLF